MFRKTNIRRRYSKGFTLMELMVSVALFSTVVLGMAAIYLFAVDQFKNIEHRIKGEEDIAWASYYIKAMLSQADSLDVVPADDIDISNNRPDTIVETFTCTGCKACGGEDSCSTSTPPKKPDRLAVFARQSSYPTNNGVTQIQVEYSPSGIFFERPKKDKPGTLHLVYNGTSSGNPVDDAGKSTYNIKYEKKTNPDPVTGKEYEFERSIEIGDLVGLEIRTDKGSSKRASNTYVTLHVRYYLDGGKDLDDRRYCELQNTGTTTSSCPSKHGFLDVQNSITVIYRNNNLDNLTDTSGNKLYFYRMIKPPRRL